jgi:hypothetical protein
VVLYTYLDEDIIISIYPAGGWNQDLISFGACKTGFLAFTSTLVLSTVIWLVSNEMTSMFIVVCSLQIWRADPIGEFHFPQVHEIPKRVVNCRESTKTS